MLQKLWEIGIIYLIPVQQTIPTQLGLGVVDSHFT